MTQMNGAELPSGCALKVEPADSGYQQQQEQQNISIYGPAAAAILEDKKAEPIETKTKDGEGDDNDSTGDLDDFFESLE